MPAKSGVTLTFSGKLDAKAATDPKNYSVKTWGLKRSKEYGSNHYDEKPSIVKAASLSADGKSVTLDIADLKPTWCMAIKYTIKGAGGEPVNNEIDNTIHQLGD